ncbi:hypothetical protein DR095_02855 [Mycoplasma flocculare]|uniref:Uncharacterized protein n=1 Tax=Mesomycoplasma flocculare TaxID=2128 RepID=A0AAW9XAZ2_MESFC|nr:hypothetical protein [Mesomycoplasma flocculare]MXR39716.1 hypothetical protein [Mycoplasma sp. MF12]MXR06112.1 hypothetical protein [Mesomycoplasma flocculare]MXR12521.1 hypothetical protein [Mesomycoplasma flocculare]MXR13795.1 hypothetical protein [Mesomycoplasma flocculare]MXR22816.1 hypothetical protein [Mesomycoplasma flocculare]
MKKTQMVCLIILVGALSSFGYLAYKLQSHIAPAKQVAITILKGVRNPGTKFFNYGVKWGKIFQEFDIIPGYDIGKYNLEAKVTIDQQVELNTVGFRTKLGKIAIKNAEKLKISREIVAKIRSFLKSKKNKKLTWKELEWNLEIDSETLRTLQENFILD